MSYENSGEGALFRNKNKKKDTHPNMRGTITVTCPHCKYGSEHWVSAWTRTPKSNPNGDKYQSLALNPKEGQPSATQSAASNESFDDDIPF